MKQWKPRRSVKLFTVSGGFRMLDSVIDDAIRHVLAHSGNCETLAAERLGISRATVANRLRLREKSKLRAPGKSRKNKARSSAFPGRDARKKNDPAIAKEVRDYDVD